MCRCRARRPAAAAPSATGRRRLPLQVGAAVRLQTTAVKGLGHLQMLQRQVGWWGRVLWCTFVWAVARWPFCRLHMAAASHGRLLRLTVQACSLGRCADDDDDSEDGGNGSGGGGTATRGRGRPPKKGKAAADAASVKATREKARREKLNEWCARCLLLLLRCACRCWQLAGATELPLLSLD